MFIYVYTFIYKIGGLAVRNTDAIERRIANSFRYSFLLELPDRRAMDQRIGEPHSLKVIRTCFNLKFYNIIEILSIARLVSPFINNYYLLYLF